MADEEFNLKCGWVNLNAALTMSVLLLAGCAGNIHPSKGAGSGYVSPEQLGVPSLADQLGEGLGTRAFAIGPNDRLAIKIAGYSEFNSDTVVDGAGNINLPLVGSVHASGLPPAQLADLLARVYDQTYLKNPRVSVSLTEMKSQYVTIEGAVKLPGVYQAVGQMRLSTAIALAQGENEFAALQNVAVFRSISGKRYAAIFSIKDIRRGIYADPEIFPNDTVVVGESSFRRLFRDIVQTSPFIAVFRPFG